MTTEEKVHTETTASEETPEVSEKGLQKTKNAIINAIDENGNGEIDIEDVIIKGLRIPGIRINRAEFLQKGGELAQILPHYEITDASCGAGVDCASVLGENCVAES